MLCASARMLVLTLDETLDDNDDSVQTDLNWGSRFVFVFFEDRVSLGSSRASNPLCSSCLSFPSAGFTGASTMHLKVLHSSISAVWKEKSLALFPCRLGRGIILLGVVELFSLFVFVVLRQGFTL